MNNTELRDVLVTELGIGELPIEAQNEIVSKLGEIILKSVTISILEKLPKGARDDFDRISISGDNGSIQKFLSENVPNMPALMEAEVKRVLQSYREGDEVVL